MRRQIKVKGVARTEPDVRLYVTALLEIARQLQTEQESDGEQRRDADPDTPIEKPERAS